MLVAGAGRKDAEELHGQQRIRRKYILPALTPAETLTTLATLAITIFGASTSTMSFTKGPSISLTYDQVEELVSQLSADDKERLALSLKRKGVKASWDEIFAAIKPGQVSQREIDRVVKQVRSKRQAHARGEAAEGRR